MATAWQAPNQCRRPSRPLRRQPPHRAAAAPAARRVWRRRGRRRSGGCDGDLFEMGHGGDFRCAPGFRSAVGAGGGTRTHTTLPSRDFKSLASTSSATSAPLFLIGFLPRSNECFPGQCSRFPKRCKTCSPCVPHPIEGPDDVRLRLDVSGVALAHALRLVAQQVGHLRVVGAAGPLPPRGIGDAQAVQGGPGRSGRLAPSRAGSGSRGSAFPFRSATAFHRRLLVFCGSAEIHRVADVASVFIQSKLRATW